MNKQELQRVASGLGKANVKKYGREHMSKIVRNFWNSPAGLKRRKEMSKNPIRSRINSK